MDVDSFVRTDKVFLIEKVPSIDYLDQRRCCTLANKTAVLLLFC
jgi:hypothetical protein